MQRPIPVDETRHAKVAASAAAKRAPALAPAQTARPVVAASLAPPGATQAGQTRYEAAAAAAGGRVGVRSHEARTSEPLRVSPAPEGSGVDASVGGHENREALLIILGEKLGAQVSDHFPLPVVFPFRGAQLDRESFDFRAAGEALVSAMVELAVRGFQAFGEASKSLAVAVQQLPCVLDRPVHALVISVPFLPATFLFKLRYRRRYVVRNFVEKRANSVQ